MTRLLAFRRPRLAIFALAVFAFAALTVWRVQTLYAERALALATARTTVATAAVYISNYIARTVDAADLLSADTHDFIARQGGLGVVAPDALRRQLLDQVGRTSIQDNMVVVDAAGRIVATSSSPTSGPAPRFDDREWFKAHQAGADRYLGPAVRSRVVDQVLYTYSLALRGPDGSLQGVVSVGIAPSQPPPLTARKPGEPLGQLWTSEGRLLLASHMDFDASGASRVQPRPFKQIPAGPAGFLPSTPDQITAFATPIGQRLLATVTLQRDEVLAPWRDDLVEALVFLLVSGLIMAVLAALASRFADQDYRARMKLQQTADALALAVEEKELLLKEVHHRVKNNLQITSNLIRLQSKQFADPEVQAAFAQTQQRLRSISLVHDVLYNEHTSARVDLSVYLRELTGEIATANGADARGIKVTIDAEPLTLSPSQITPLGLSVGEVLTNAFKHAFPESGGGELFVGAHRSGDQIEVTVQDNGRGYDGGDARAGSLGLKLISVLTQQLRGRFSFTRANGTVFRLSFPAGA